MRPSGICDRSSPGLPVAFDQVFDQGCSELDRGQGIDTDVVVRPFHGQQAGQGDDAPLAGAVIGIACCEADLAADGGHIDNAAPLPRWIMCLPLPGRTTTPR